MPHPGCRLSFLSFSAPPLSFLFLAPCLKVSLPLVWTLPYFWAPCSDIVQSLGSWVDDLPPSWPRASQGTCRKTVEPRAELPGCPVPGWCPGWGDPGQPREAGLWPWTPRPRGSGPATRHRLPGTEASLPSGSQFLPSKVFQLLALGLQ